MAGKITRRRILPYQLLARYIEDLISLCSAPSITGIQLEQLRDGTIGCSGGGSGCGTSSAYEDRLIRLVDRWPTMPRLAIDEIKLLLAYSSGGDIVPVVGEGGYVVDVTMTGASHEYVARKMGLKSPAEAHSKYRAIVDRLLEGGDFFCSGY
jgi:hypothetical protein